MFAEDHINCIIVRIDILLHILPWTLQNFVILSQIFDMRDA